MSSKLADEKVLIGLGELGLRSFGNQGSIVVVDMDDARIMITQFFLFVIAVGEDNDRVSHMHQSGSSSVETDLARLAEDRIGFEAGAVVDVEYRYLLVLKNIGDPKQFGVDADRTDVVEVGAGNRGTMNLGFEHSPSHYVISSRSPRLVGDGPIKFGLVNSALTSEARWLQSAKASPLPLG